MSIELLKRATASGAVRLFVSAAILAYLASRIDMAAAGRALVGVSVPHLLTVLGLVALDRSVMILRWVLLLRGSAIVIPARHAAEIFLVSAFVGSFLPAGIGGDVARAYGLSRVTTSGKDALASVVIDRVLGILSLLSMGLAGLMLWPSPWSRDWRVLTGVALLTAFSVALFWSERLVEWLLPTRLVGGRIGGRLARTAEALSRYRGRGGTLLHVFAWSLFVQWLRITQAYTLALGLGIHLPFLYFLLVMPIGLFMLLLPVSISGFGLPQGVIVWLLQPMGVSDEHSLALSTLIVLTGLAGNLPGLWLWLRKRREIL